jgi:hypothetical protein
MRPVKLRPGTATDATALSRLIDTAYSDMKSRVEKRLAQRNDLRTYVQEKMRQGGFGCEPPD